MGSAENELTMNEHEKNLLQEANVSKALRDGPRLRSGYNVWIVCRDRTSKMVKVGGLGGFGVGQMWLPEADRHRNYPGYDDAPEEQCPN